MKIVVIGGNTAAHFISKKLLEDPSVKIVYHFDANDNNTLSDRYRPINNITELIKFLEENHIDLIIPTLIQSQICSDLQAKIKELKIPVMMPTEDLALIEWSKITGKHLLTKLNIPTAPFKIYKRASLLLSYFEIKRPFVIKYEREYRSGLQTIIVTDDNYLEEFEQFKTLNSAGHMNNKTCYIVEEFIDGICEYSYHALCNTTGWTYLGSARDYKKFKDEDSGFNTSSMGSYAPVHSIDSRISNYVDNIVNHFIKEGTPYIGVLYLGILIKKDGTPIVLEINTRPGDPEIQPILSILDKSISIAELFYKTATNQSLPKIKFESNLASVSISIVHKDYLSYVYEDSKDNIDITNPTLCPEEKDICISYSKKRLPLNSVITAIADTPEHAADKIYKFLSNKNMYNYTYRTDIGYLK
jgi:phosphoribosylamine--glycine ligase